MVSSWQRPDILVNILQSTDQPLRKKNCDSKCQYCKGRKPGYTSMLFIYHRFTWTLVLLAVKIWHQQE